jgi:hypothetical protein
MILDEENDPEPYHDSILTGELYCQELLRGNPRRFYDENRMDKSTFERLVRFLKNEGVLGDTR